MPHHPSKWTVKTLPLRNSKRSDFPSLISDTLVWTDPPVRLFRRTLGNLWSRCLVLHMSTCASSLPSLTTKPQAQEALLTSEEEELLQFQNRTWLSWSLDPSNNRKVPAVLWRSYRDPSKVMMFEWVNTWQVVGGLRSWMGKKLECHLAGRGRKVGDGDADWMRPVPGPFVTQSLLPGYLKLNQVLGVRVKHEVHHSSDVYADSAAEVVWAGGGGGGGGGVEADGARRERYVCWAKTHD